MKRIDTLLLLALCSAFFFHFPPYTLTYTNTHSNRCILCLAYPSFPDLPISFPTLAALFLILFLKTYLRLCLLLLLKA